ncbi:serine protease [Corallococcus sp. AB049A]|nr:serine protease [Corallococcus sp. AB049A]
MLLGALLGMGFSYLTAPLLPEGPEPYDFRNWLPGWIVLVSAIGAGAIQLRGFGRATPRWRRSMMNWLLALTVLSAGAFGWATRAEVPVSYQGRVFLWLTALGPRLPSCLCEGTDATCIKDLGPPENILACWGHTEVRFAGAMLAGTLLLACAFASAAVGLLLMRGLEHQRVLEVTGNNPPRVLEKVITRQNPFLDPVAWRQRLVSLERRICRIDVSGQPVGTGFLIGPDLVMTNHHVIEQLVRRAASPSNLTCVFDYRSDGGRAVGAGRPCHLAADWQVDLSPHSPVDEESDPKRRDPTDDELDHAVLRLSEKVGNDVTPDGERGWISLPDTFPLVARDPLVILQHPQGRPLQVAIDTEAILGLNRSGNRVRYRTNTEPGSSGSPCFDLHLTTLVALHHSGDPSSLRAVYNEGIPANCLRRRLVARGIL